MQLTGPPGLMGITHGTGRRLALWGLQLECLVQRGRNITYAKCLSFSTCSR
jgi:hypothetical protein